MSVVGPPFDVGQFFASKQVELCDLLAPHLEANDLATLACVARTFCAWPTLAHRRCRLAPRHKFEAHGHTGDRVVMRRRRTIKLDVVMLEKYMSTSGRRWPRMVSPGSGVDLANSLIDVDLVCERTGHAVEKLFANKMFKCDTRGKKDTHGYRWRPVGFQIRGTLSSNHPPPGLFRLRVTARVARLGRPGYGTYEHFSRCFAVVNHNVLQKRHEANARAL